MSTTNNNEELRKKFSELIFNGYKLTPEQVEICVSIANVNCLPITIKHHGQDK